ncbi:hypothetical protein [Pseudooceanicola sediminis]|nr:hypothetical protein [Pseudooceanicola sediminis]
MMMAPIRKPLCRPGIGRDCVAYIAPGGVVHVDRWPVGFATAVLRASDVACAEVLARATPPVSCGPEIPVAPARGPMVAFTPVEGRKTREGTFEQYHAGYLGRDAARRADAFDLMTDQARRAHPKRVAAAKEAHDTRSAAATGPVPDFVPPAFAPPFSIGQVAVGRDYAALTERCACAGVKCSSLEAQRASGGRAGDREAAVFRDFERLRVYHRRIGDGLAKEVRRIRPGGAKRSAIRARYLVDQVCLGGMSLAGVLSACGWCNDAKTREGLRLALCAALDRMQGHDLVTPTKGD